MKLFRYPIPILIVMILIVLMVGAFLDSQRQKSSQLPLKPKLVLQDIAEQIVSACENTHGSQTLKKICYAKEFENPALQYGATVAFEILNLVQDKDVDAQGCHLIAHGIGRGVFEHNPSNWQQEINASYAQRCSYGFTHGVLESYVKTLPEGAMTKKAFPTICGESSKGGCYHGLGHLILVHTQLDIEKAIDFCSVLENKQNQLSCFRGVFMEYMTALNLIEHGLAPEEWRNSLTRFQNIQNLCQNQPAEKAAACWHEIPHVALIKFRNNPQEIFDFCHTAQTPEAQTNCKLHTVDLFNDKRKYDLFAVKDLCLLETSRDPFFEESCYIRLVTGIFATNPRHAAETIAFCASLKQEFQPACFQKIGSRLKTHLDVGGQKLNDICREAPEEMQDLCLGQSSKNK